jgi:succinyl-diaminopimelate desuccinylase
VTLEIDPVELTRDLIRCPSVTPADAGALDVLQSALERLGFACHRLKFSAPDTPDVDNLYARIGHDGVRNFCFAGHTDVVPVGDRAAWSADPFAAELRDDHVIGRGAADMKGAIAAFAAAAARFIVRCNGSLPGAISLLITGDEEGPAINGTKPVLEWLRGHGERLDACIVGEPTNPTRLGEMIKIGRRGSLTARLTVRGTQGHTAYPQLADNPIHRLLKMLTRVTERPLDQGTAHFQPSTLQISTIDVGNPASNVIPAEARACFNIRFNDKHSGRSLERWLRDELDTIAGAYDLKVQVSGESFLTPPGPLSDLVAAAVERVLREKPELSTTGGTSDARFIKDFCPVVEFGLAGATMHKVDERVPVADILALSDVYAEVLAGYFSDGPR